VSDPLDPVARQVFGRTRQEALEQRVCIRCGENPTFTTEAGRREYEISAVCEPCFDAMFGDDG
jgi:hypothetical protein